MQASHETLRAESVPVMPVVAWDLPLAAQVCAAKQNQPYARRLNPSPAIGCSRRCLGREPRRLGAAYVPRKIGWRFSRKARIPS